ncbi:hypothetical protein C5B85_15660 [Pseudoclavibacter sp. AY1F1]|uniref:hypothetical protein n=1 Tax=Pseudoclavibacter sp. AY1F1 TaxID=2080583 RepID=UPI000CE8937D|nr:hypothetical protein [Pseudoclavibacter sp. AY1F1]PPF42707.1 hypothetical protein C5B85_15660 [Pseudoclavibacter sp. AY1F1]
MNDELPKADRALHNSRPVGEPLPEWMPRRLPDADRLQGWWCTLKRLDADRHADEHRASDGQFRGHRRNEHAERNVLQAALSRKNPATSAGSVVKMPKSQTE